MDMSLANQALPSEYLIVRRSEMKREVYLPPEEADGEIASLKLNGLDLEMDVLTPEQECYPSSLTRGT
jgi:adenosylhomocysteinase